MARTKYEEIEEFGSKVGLHQGSALFLFLYVFLMGLLTKKERDRERWELLFAYDSLIITDTQNEVQRTVMQ